MSLFDLLEPETSPLAALAAEVTKDLPAQIRKVIDTAITCGWELNPPGMTLCLRLNHPTDALAEPVYITWAVGRTPTGRMSFRFVSCGTRGLIPLSGADLLEYLQDPTVALMTDEDIAQAVQDRDTKAALKAEESRHPWNPHADQMSNLQAQLGATVLRIEQTRGVTRANPPSKAPVRPLRIQAPRIR